MSLVMVESADGVAVVTMNRPEAMNALSRALQDALAEALERVANDDAVRAIILTGQGERAFTAGLDLKEIGAHGLALAPGGRGRDPLASLAACRKPVIGAVNGVAVTGGFELALACDILIASTNARFADTHVRVGVTPGWGLSQRLSRTVGAQRAKALSLTGNFLDADTALAWGLVAAVVAPEALLPTARAMAADIASCDPDMVARYKALIDEGFALALGEGLSLEARRARDDNVKVSADAVAMGNAGLMARGREQSR
jgi:enoyl-CoA hydratase